MKHNKKEMEKEATPEENMSRQPQQPTSEGETGGCNNDTTGTPEGDNKSEADWEAKYNELNDAHLRLMADFDNYRKRNIKEKADLIKNASERVITDFLPIVDNLERALASMANAEDVNAVAEGVQLIYTQIMTMLQGNGVTVIETDNLPLDTDVHDAITTIPAPTPEQKGKIVDCVKKGYKLNEKVIRHSQVVVGE